MRNFRATALIATVLLLASCTPAGSTKPAQAPSIVVPAVGGGDLKIADYRGQVVYVDFWATWCGPCIDSIPELNMLHEKYKDRGFAVLGISVDDLKLEAVAEFSQANKILYPVALGKTEDMALFGPSPGLPTGYLVSREGLIVKRFIGQLPAEKLEAEIVAALDEAKAEDSGSGQTDEGAH